MIQYCQSSVSFPKKKRLKNVTIALLWFGGGSIDNGSSCIDTFIAFQIARSSKRWSSGAAALKKASHPSHPARIPPADWLVERPGITEHPPHVTHVARVPIDDRLVERVRRAL